jgi:hypothetical protein
MSGETPFGYDAQNVVIFLVSGAVLGLVVLVDYFLRRRRGAVK